MTVIYWHCCCFVIYIYLFIHKFLGAVSTELENARPQTAGEEELQLQLALAMSKEEAEQEERLRRNDDLRLQMALNESQENYQRGKPEDGDSASADLLNLSTSLSGNVAAKTATDPWGLPVPEVSFYLTI